MTRLGIPYMGSKNKIARKIVDLLPAADTLVELFAGGCAVTHAAILARKFRRYLINDIQGRYPDLFCRAVRGELPPPRIYTREEFDAAKDTDPIAAVCWSFGNNPGKSYLWRQDIAAVKLTATKMIIDPDWQSRFAAYKSYIKSAREFLSQPGHPYELEPLDRLVNLERLQSLQSLQSLHPVLIPSGLDYTQVEIPVDATVYADPPYAGPAEYAGTSFDHPRFYDWLRSVPFPVFVSEYSMPPDFRCLAAFDRVGTFGYTNREKCIERIFVHERFAQFASHAAGLLGMEVQG